MFYLLCISILAASFNSIMLNKARINKNEIFKFNLLASFIWCIILFVTNKGSVHIDSQVLLWGIIYGLTQAFFIFFKTAAMNGGSVAITTLIGNCSLIISIFVSLVVWKEKITIIDIIGLIILLAAIYMCTYKNTNTSHPPKWIFSVFFFRFCRTCGNSF